MSRLVDLIAMAAVAVVLLLPKPSLDAKPALVGEKVELDRIAQLEDARLVAPDDVGVAIELADAYLRLLYPEWALETLASFGETADPRVHLVRTTALAERLDVAAAVAEAARGEKACDALGDQCSPLTRIRLQIIGGPMRALLESGIDPRKDPKAAAREVSKILHATKQTPPKK